MTFKDICFLVEVFDLKCNNIWGRIRRCNTVTGFVYEKLVIIKRYWSGKIQYPKKSQKKIDQIYLLNTLKKKKKRLKENN